MMGTPNDLEQTKWLISRIDMLHQTTIEEFRNQSRVIDAMGKKIISKTIAIRNYFLSVLGIALTVIIGVAPIYEIDVDVFSILISGIFVIGIAIFGVYSWVISKVEGVFDFLEEKAFEEIGNISESHGFLITSMSVLSNVTLKQAFNYLTFSILLNYAVTVQFSKSIKKHAKKYKKIPPFEIDLIALSKEVLPSTDLVPHYLESLDKTERLPKNLVEIIEKNLERQYRTGNRE